MFLAPYVKELLFTYECVVVPGLGAFVTQYNQAVVEEGSSMTPPSKVVGFNAALTEDDGLLVAHLCRRLKQSNGAVSVLLAREVASIFETLSSGSTYTFEGIGVFHQDVQGKLHFTATQGVNFLLDSFGLGSFKFPRLEEERSTFFKNPIIFRQSESVVRENLPGTKPEHKYTAVSPYLIGAAVLVFLVIALLPYNSRVTHSLFRHPASLGPLPSLIVLDPPVDALVSSGSVIENPPVGVRVTGESEAQEGTVVMRGNYPIIAGSFEQEANAIDLANQLISMGYAAEVRLSPQSFYRVILVRYDHLEAAQNALLALQPQLPSLNLWILK